MRVRKTKPSQPFAIPQGAAIYGTVTETSLQGQRAILVHGEGGPGTGIRVKRGAFEIALPSTTIVGVPPGPIYVAWDGIGYKLCGSLREIQADDNLALIGSVGSVEGVIPRAQLTAATAGGRPPLHSISCEQIDQLLHHMDQQHWPNIIAMRIKRHYPLDVPVPSPAPETLMGNIRRYASMLYKTEADQYEQFRSDGRYPAWLLRLAERVIGRVLAALERLDEADPDALLLGFHGLTKPDIEKELKTFLWEIGRQYEQGTAPSQRKIATPPPPPLPPEIQAQMTGTLKYDDSVAAAYTAMGVDIASGSPLLKMVAATAGRGAHSQPSNVQSGKRIGRSIHSEKAAQRMEAYIQDKGITQTQFSVAVNADTKTLYRFRRTGKVEKSVARRIAEAMGITLEQFTA